MRKFALLLLLFSLNACKTKDVAPLPKSEFIYTINDEGLVKFQATSINATSYQWVLDGTTRNAANFDYGFGKNQSYQVSLTSKNDAGSDVVVKSIPINNITGSVMIYRKFTVGQNRLAVDVDGQFAGYIQAFYYTSTPDCGNSYSVTKTKLSPGSHSYSVTELNTSNYWNGSVNINAGVCSAIGLTK